MNRKLRFHILHRDSFTCQYCGRRAPNVVLHVDHVLPVSKGGTDHPLNLKTACHDCNMGKFVVDAHDVRSLSAYIEAMAPDLRNDAAEWYRDWPYDRDADPLDRFMWYMECCGDHRPTFLLGPCDLPMDLHGHHPPTAVC